MSKIKTNWLVKMEDPEGSSWKIVEILPKWGCDKWGLIHDCPEADMYLIRHGEFAQNQHQRCESCEARPPSNLWVLYRMCEEGNNE